jgi:ribosomal-protein-alanine N-acetyltransferase
MAHPVSASPTLNSLPGRSRLAVEPMTLADIPGVMDIERAAFPLPWPEQAYEYELLKNPNAFFIVARATAPAGANGTAHPARDHTSWGRRLLARLSAGMRRAGARHAAALTVAGYAGMWMFADEAHISTIASHPGWRGQGVGELLLFSLIREAERRDAVFVTLEVRVGNLVAQNLYRKYRFEDVGRRKHYYRDNGEDAIIMTVQTFQTPEYKARLAELETALAARMAG